MKKSKGFSLAEILLGTGMLTVIAVLVISSIVSPIEDEKIYNVKYERLYNDIFTASQTILLMDRKGTFPFTQAEGAESIKNAFAQRLDITNASMSGFDKEPFVILQNGTKLTFRVGDSAKDADKNYEDFVGAIVIDFNGEKLPNEIGKDIRFIPLCANGICKKIIEK